MPNTFKASPNYTNRIFIKLTLLFGYSCKGIFIFFILYKCFNILFDDNWYIVIGSAVILTLILNYFEKNYKNYYKRLLVITNRLVKYSFIFVIFFILLGTSPIFMEPTDIESNNTNTNNEIENISNKDGNGSRGENSLVHKSQIDSQTGETMHNININISSKTLEQTGDIVKSSVSSISNNILPNIGASAAAAAAVKAASSASQNLPLIPRLGIIGATTLVAGASAKAGIVLGSAVSDIITERIKNPIYNNTASSSVQKGGTPAEVEENIPSPDDYTASSVNETNQFFTATFNIENSPVQIILTGILQLAILSMFLNIVFLVQLFNRFILKSNFDYILGLVDKYAPSKHKERVKKWFIKGNEKNNRFYFIMFVINSILLIIILLMIIVVTTFLLNDLDHLCEVHINYFANKK